MFSLNFKYFPITNEMFSSSTQRHHWTFANEEELRELRVKSNNSYIRRVEASTSMESRRCFLIPEEELIIVRHYERVLADFLRRFMPRNEPLPRKVKGTAVHLFKRFYLVTSVMEYHPKEMLITCVFLSCKLSEYHMPLEVFVRGIGGDQKKLKNFILDQEMVLLYRIKFQLNFYLPYSSIDGLMIDLRTRSTLQRPERLHEHIGSFLSHMWSTDECLLHPPSLIALAAVMHATSCCKENIDTFVVNTLLNKPTQERLRRIINTVRSIRKNVTKQRDVPARELITQLESRLAKCRNPRNDPSSEVFKKAMMEQLLDTY